MRGKGIQNRKLVGEQIYLYVIFGLFLQKFGWSEKFRGVKVQRGFCLFFWQFLILGSDGEILVFENICYKKVLGQMFSEGDIVVIVESKM